MQGMRERERERERPLWLLSFYFLFIFISLCVYENALLMLGYYYYRLPTVDGYIYCIYIEYSWGCWKFVIFLKSSFFQS